MGASQAGFLFGKIMLTKLHFSRSLTALGLFWLASLRIDGAVLWSEASDGDLPGESGAPQFLTVTLGENTVAGRMGQTGDLGATNGSDADYLTVIVPDGLEVVAITVESFFFSGDGNPGGGSFLAYGAGAEFAGQGFGDIDGYVIFAADAGNLLPGLRQDIFGDGSQNSLSPGEHAFWLQETNPTIVEYSLAFEVVPEPSSLGLLALGFGFMLGLRRRPRSC
ncbi:MAG: PEP-CTERM sorting domain-containing protein [Roseibacillus sp.]|nr:PEP-CTERM sorting domain-containing protein [Roseibacillus sp.]